jgi:hypothetical protein
VEGRATLAETAIRPEDLRESAAVDEGRIGEVDRDVESAALQSLAKRRDQLVAAARVELAMPPDHPTLLVGERFDVAG